MHDGEEDDGGDGGEDEEGAVAEVFGGADVAAYECAVVALGTHEWNDGAGEAEIHEDGDYALEGGGEAELGVGVEREAAD